MTDKPNDPLRGISEAERRTMGRLLGMPVEQKKDSPKPDTARAEAQRRRREREREKSATTSNDAP